MQATVVPSMSSPMKMGGGPQLPKIARGKLCNYSVRFSPFEANKLVLAQAQYFGVVGAGAVSLLQVI